MTPISRVARGPLYYWLLNTGYGLWLDKKLAGQLYLQHKKFLTHINDIEINDGFRGWGLSHQLIDFAEKEARKQGYSFLTLGVTNTNRRAVNLYLKTGYLEQHHKYYYLSRPTWADPPDVTSYLQSRKNIILQPFKGQEARKSLSKFFAMEQRASNPETAPVWEAYYQPKIPASGKGVSFSIQFGQNSPSEGHADFFDWGERGRWRIHLNPERWGTPEEKVLLEVLINQARGFSYQWVSLGSQRHHDLAHPLTNSLGLVERNGERMLMVKLLN
jgi:predicted GNAT family acetyltransferase